MKNIFISVLILLTTFISYSQNVQLTKKMMTEDYSVLKAALEQFHPGLYKFNSPQEMRLNFKDFESQLSNTMDIKQFYLHTAELVTKIKCGHTFLNPLNLKNDVSKQIISNDVMPLYFKVINGKFIITHNLSGLNSINKGDEIVSIDGVSSQKIINQLLKVSRGDGNNAMGKKISNLNVSPDEVYAHSLFDIFFPLYFGDKASRQITVKTFKGKLKTYKISSITADKRMELYSNNYGKPAEGKDTWVAKNVDNQTSLLKFGTFSFWNSNFNYKAYIDSVFTNIYNDKNIKNLIIDLRGNEGGSGEIRNQILSYITAKPLNGESYSKICYRYLSVSDSLRKYLSTWDKSFYKPKNKEEYMLNEIGLYQKIKEDEKDNISPNTKHFKGNVFLITDAICSSSTFDMAWTFQYNKLGTIVGETTGGTKKGLDGGEMFFLTLPNSKIEVDLPLIYYYHKNMPDEGVIPEYKIATTQANVAKGEDAQISYILKSLIR